MTHPDRDGRLEWLYFKVYVGAAFAGLDYLITKTLPQVLREVACERWFFLRYADEGGVHLRARFLCPPVSGLALHLTGIWSAALSMLPQLPPSTYRPMVLLSNPGVATRNVPTGKTAVEVDTYEPEFGKFGGPIGMPIAETVFQASSLTALGVLQSEDTGEVSRKQVAPGLMSAVVAAFPPRAAAREFWRQYSLYWLGGDSSAARDWRARFFAKAKQLAERGIPVVAPAGDVPLGVRPVVDGWTRALDTGASRYAEETRWETATADMLAFQFVHLMNNRLGLTALDEAYVAALMEHSSPEDDRMDRSTL